MPDTAPTTTKLCPTCGTRLSETATRCLVCGSVLSTTAPDRSTKSVQGTRMPEITLSLPAALGFLALFLTIGAVLIFFTLRGQPGAKAAAANLTPSPTVTITTTPTRTPTVTNTAPPLPTSTPLPPLNYKVVAGDTCISIAATHHISVDSIVRTNNLSTDCALSPGQTLSLPQPTPTASPQPTATLAGAEATTNACEKTDYSVKDGDSLNSISKQFNVPTDAIAAYNGLVNNVVFPGTKLTIPLCERNRPAGGPTSTGTSIPPYSAPDLLLPINGTGFSAGDTITLQWASVGLLRDNEAYAVTIEDLTSQADTGQPRQFVDYVKDTRYAVPDSFRPSDTKPHIINWSILPVRQVGTTQDGKAIWQPAGTVSDKRVLIWSGGSGPQPTATPTP